MRLLKFLDGSFKNLNYGFFPTIFRIKLDSKKADKEKKHINPDLDK